MLACPAHEVYQHVVLARRRHSADLGWAAAVSCLPDMRAEGRAEVLEGVARLGRAGRTRASAYELVDDATRLAMVGHGIGRHGWESFARNRPDEARWLASVGRSPADALAAWREQDARDRANPFWER